MVVGVLGILKAGGAYLPLDPGLSDGAPRSTCWRMPASAVLRALKVAGEGAAGVRGADRVPG